MMPSTKVPTPEQDVAYGEGAAEIRRSLRYSNYFLGRSEKSHMPFVAPIIAQRFCVEEAGALGTACVLAIILTFVDWYRNGGAAHTVLLIGGATASIVASAFLIIHCVKALQADHLTSGFGMLVNTLIGFVPFLFAIYLIAVQSLYMLIQRFSVAQLFQSICFLLIGHWIVTRIRRLQEFQSCVYEQLS